MRIFIVLIVSTLVHLQVAAQNNRKEATFSYEGIIELQVEGNFFDIEMMSAPGKSLEFYGFIEGDRKDDYDIIYSRSGNTAIVKIDKKGGGWNWGWDNGQARLEFKVPAGITINADNSSGDITITGINSASHKVGSSSGDIVIRDVVGDLNVRSSSGDLSLEGIEGNLDARSSSGDQVFNNVSGDITFVASSGDVEINGCTGYIKGETSSGDIELDKVIGAFELEASSGDIEARNMQIQGKSSFISSSGNIKLGLDQDINSLDYEAKSGSGDITIGNNEAEDYLKLSNGNSHSVYLRTNSGNVKIYN